MAKDRYGYANTPPSYAMSNPMTGSRWNTATGNQVFEEPSGETNIVPDYLKGKVVNPASQNVTDFGTSDFDVTDTNEVLKLQQSLGLKEDGIFGPKTESAYRTMVNERRAGEGKAIYNYDDSRRIDPPFPSQIPDQPDPIGEGYVPSQEYNENYEPIMMRNNLDSDNSASSRLQSGLKHAEDSRQALPADQRSLWGMISGMFNRGGQ